MLPLRENWIDGVEDDRQRDDAAGLHLVQHPCRSDAAFGRIQHQYLANIGLARQFVRRPREGAGDTIEIVTRRKPVIAPPARTRTVCPIA